MKKTVFKIPLLLLFIASLTACNILDFWKDEESGDRIQLTFYGWGNETEVSLTEQFVDEYNKSQDEIYVNYTSIPSNDYATKIRNALSRNSAPDVILAGDGEIKPWIEMGGLANLDDYIAKSKVFDFSDFWTEGQNRYLYNIETRMNGSGHYYGIMRDLSPTVLFYNKKAFEKVGIQCVSLTKEESIDQYNTDKAFFQIDEGKYIFNNKIALNWDELLEVSRLNTKSINGNSLTQYGVYYVNWFSLGWSVGANSLQWVKDDSYSLGGYYKFTLDDDNPNWCVKDGETITIGEETYTGNTLVDYWNITKLTPEDKAKCWELPSSLEATQYYVDLSSKEMVSPKPDFTASTSQYNLFSSGNQVAMSIDSRYSVGIWRNTIKNGDKGFDWDCAPCPQHEHGIPAGHSGSLAYCITEKSKNKEAAFKFIEYINGEAGQSAFSEAGYTIPNTKTLSNSPAFLVPKTKPVNSQLFIDAAAYQTVGDWGFLPSKDWINPWANILNSDVLNGKRTLKSACDVTRELTQSTIDGYYAGINYKVK